MATKSIVSRVANKFDTAANWATSTLVLLKGEIAIQEDGKFKFGDGVHKYSELEFASAQAAVVSTVDPTASDVSYDIGTTWVNTTSDTIFVYVGETIWQKLSSADAYSKTEINQLLATKVNKTDISAVATSGSYTDLINKPSTFAPPVATTTVLGGVKSGTDITVDASGNVSVVDDSHNHIITNIDGLQAALDAKVSTSTLGNTVATLTDGKVPASQLPSYVDDILDYDTLTDFPVTGETGKIYVAKDTNKIYRWSGSVYAEVSSSLALGTTASTAFPGDRGLALETTSTNLTTRVGSLETTVGGLGSLATKSTITTTDITNGAVTDAKISEVNLNKVTQTVGDILILNCGISV